jgi:hypothetical protein
VKTLSQILSECRKFGLYLHLAHQTLGQLNDRLISALGNVGIKISFTIDREDAEIMAKKLFAVDTTEIKSEAKTEIQQHVYSPLPEQWERLVANLQNLPPQTAWVKQRAKRPVRIKTHRIRPYNIGPDQVEQLQTQLVRLHGVPVANSVHERELLTPPVQLTDWEQRPNQSGLVYIAS